MVKTNLNLLVKKAQKEIEKSRNLKELDGVFNKYLAKKGEISRILNSLKKLPKKKRAKVGKKKNEIKKILAEKIEQKKQKFKTDLKEKSDQEQWFDITVPGKKIALGHLHPLGQIRKKIEDIFQSMGFSVVDGPEVETPWYNFDALNIPADHPARDLWDTFWLKDVKKKFLLRTHTSPVQVRYLEKNQPPLRIIVPGRVFRHEATDASHETDFWQVEGLMIGKDISIANFKAVIEKFLQEFFGRETKMRLRPSYFPFVEPGFEVDIFCSACQGNGCPVCKQMGWVEIIGAGMVHPNVLKNAGLNPKGWTGFAFGMGMNRLAMMKYKIDDIRLFNSGDLRFLQQF